MMTSIKHQLNTIKFLTALFLLNYSDYVFADLCSICNCCLPNIPSSQNKIQTSADGPVANFLLQNDALVPPNPKPLNPEDLAAKFYKIDYNNAIKLGNENHQSAAGGLIAKIPFGTFLQGGDKSNTIASQAILFPVPVAALIVQPMGNALLKCRCTDTVSDATNNSRPQIEGCDCEQKIGGGCQCQTKCHKCMEAKSSEGQEEIEEEKGGGGMEKNGCKEEGGREREEEETECQSKEQQQEKNTGGESGEVEETTTTTTADLGNREKEIECEKLQSCGDCPPLEKEKAKCADYSQEDQQQEAITTDGSSQARAEQQQPQQTVVYHQEQKIPIEVFKKFVAKSSGLTTPSSVAAPENMANNRSPHDESFENLKDRLKEISSKMDLLKNLSMEIKGHNPPRQFPLLAKFGNIGRYTTNGWQNGGMGVGMGMRMAERPMESGMYGGGNNQQPQQQQQYNEMRRQPQIGAIQQYPQINMEKPNIHPFQNPLFPPDQHMLLSPTFSSMPMPNNAAQRVQPMLTATSTNKATSTTRATTTMNNHQQFLLNAIEEFLKESQKIHGTPPPKTSSTLGTAAVDVGTAKPTMIVGAERTTPSMATTTAQIPENVLDMAEDIMENLTNAITPFVTIAPSNATTITMNPMTTTTTTLPTTKNESAMLTTVAIEETPPTTTTTASTTIPTITTSSQTTTIPILTSSIMDLLMNTNNITICNNLTANENHITTMAPALSTTMTRIVGVENISGHAIVFGQQTPGPFNAHEWLISSTNDPPINGQQPEVNNVPNGNTQEIINQQNNSQILVELQTANSEQQQSTTNDGTNQPIQNDQSLADQPSFGNYEQQEMPFLGENENSTKIEDQLTSGINISRHGSTTRLINLISSLDPQDEADSSEDFNQQESSAAEQENGNNRSNEFHPKLLRTRHIKKDEVDTGSSEMGFDMETNPAISNVQFGYIVIILFQICLFINNVLYFYM